MIRLDSISKQHGKQILFLEASMIVFKGEKVGLVGPHGSGKSTIFRLVVKEEQPDSGQVAVDRGVTVGYFSQDFEAQGVLMGRVVSTGEYNLFSRTPIACLDDLQGMRVACSDGLEARIFQSLGAQAVG